MFFNLILLRMMKAESSCMRSISHTYNYVIWIVLPVIVRICQVVKDYLLNNEFKAALEKRKQTTKNLMPRSPYGVSLAISQLTASV
jgi:hypothetical protein